MRKKTLRLQIYIAIFLTFLAVTVIYGSILYPFENRRRKTVIKKIELSLKAIVEQREDELANELFLNHKEAINLILQRMLQVEGVVAISIFNSSGQLIVSTDKTSSFGLTNAKPQVFSQGHYFNEESWNSQSVLSFTKSIEVIGEHLGYLKIYYSLSEVTREAQLAFFIFSALLLTILVLIFLILNFLLGHFVTRPVGILVEAMQKVEKGNLGVKVNLKADNEIGEMAEAFNHMTGDLERITVSRDELVKEINERKRAEEALQEGERFLSDVFSAIQDGISVLDPELNIVRVNNIMEGWYAHAMPLVGKKCFGAYHLRSKHCDVCPVVETLKTGNAASEVVPKIRADGVITGWFDLFSFPIKDKDTGKIKGIVEYVRDITERKKSEEELKFAYEQLKTTQAQLVQSAKMASVGQLAGGVAHEINNPLTGVLNNVQLIRMMSEEGNGISYNEIKELLAIIEESAMRCKKITQSLLDFSHASKGAFHNVSLNELIDKVTVLIEHELNLQNVTIQKQLQPELPLVLGDAQLLQQVIFDLISNARWAIKKKGDKGEGTITLKTLYEKDRTCFTITDNGIGIVKENLNKIFEPFFTTKTVGEGTGLGLSIVYNIVQAHKGMIEVRSELNKGTTFKISLPAS